MSFFALLAEGHSQWRLKKEKYHEFGVHCKGSKFPNHGEASLGTYKKQSRDLQPHLLNKKMFSYASVAT